MARGERVVGKPQQVVRQSGGNAEGRGVANVLNKQDAQLLGKRGDQSDETEPHRQSGNDVHVALPHALVDRELHIERHHQGESLQRHCHDANRAQGTADAPRRTIERLRVTSRRPESDVPLSIPFGQT